MEKLSDIDRGKGEAAAWDAYKVLADKAEEIREQWKAGDLQVADAYRAAKSSNLARDAWGAYDDAGDLAESLWQAYDAAQDAADAAYKVYHKLAYPKEVK